jgi:hypothetical protein
MKIFDYVPVTLDRYFMMKQAIQHPNTGKGILWTQTLSLALPLFILLTIVSAVGERCLQESG